MLLSHGVGRVFDSSTYIFVQCVQFSCMCNHYTLHRLLLRRFCESVSALQCTLLHSIRSVRSTATFFHIGKSADQHSSRRSLHPSIRLIRDSVWPARCELRSDHVRSLNDRCSSPVSLSRSFCTVLYIICTVYLYITVHLRVQYLLHYENIHYKKL